MTTEFDKKAAEIEQRLKNLQPEISENKLPQPEKDEVAGQRVFAEIVGGLIFGVVVGKLIDGYLNTEPAFLIIFLILGLAGSIYNIYKATTKN